MSRDRDHPRTPELAPEPSHSPALLRSRTGTSQIFERLSQDEFRDIQRNVLQLEREPGAQWLRDGLRLEKQPTIEELQVAVRKTLLEGRPLVVSQLYAEILATSVFCSSNYDRLTGGRTNLWEGLNIGERFLLCQKADQISAAIHGRQTCHVSWFWGDYPAAFSPSGFELHINHDTVLRSDDELIALGMTTHECAHANDWHELTQVLPSDSHLNGDERRELVQNFFFPIQGGNSYEENKEYREQLSEQRAVQVELAVVQHFDEFKRRQA